MALSLLWVLAAVLAAPLVAAWLQLNGPQIPCATLEAS
jgi:hypothetical protein